MFRIAPVFVIAIVLTFTTNAEAQRRPVQIGGPNGLVMGGGMGFKLGGANGVHFGGGQGARFGGQNFGMHFGGGQGARFGGQNFGMHFGGGRGAHFGGSNIGMQFGGGQGAQIGRISPPVYGQGQINRQPQIIYGEQIIDGRVYQTPIQVQPQTRSVIQQGVPNIPSEVVLPAGSNSGSTSIPPVIEPIKESAARAHSVLERNDK